MAKKSPALVVDATTTNGTTTYTLSDPASPGAGLRTLADAVAAGFVSNGDLVGYIVVDDTKQGSTLQFERGIGTVGGGGSTLARTIIRENHLGTTAAVSWPSGGSRTVRVSLSPDDIPQLDAAQTFTALQTFGAGIDVVGTNPTVTINGGTNGNAFIELQEGANHGARLQLDGTQNLLNFQAKLSGVYTTVARLDYVNNEWEDGGGTRFAKLSDVQGVLHSPSGGVLQWGSTVVPAGWSLVTSNVNDRVVLLTSTLGDAGAVGGSWSLSGLSATTTVDGHALTENELPSHSHPSPGGGGTNFSIFGASSPTIDSSVEPGTANTGFFAATGVTGGNAAHSHTANTSVSSGSAWRPLYRKFVVIQKS